MRFHRSCSTSAAACLCAFLALGWAVMDDVPEDTDVFYVLARRPRMKEFIVTKHYYCQVNEDGSIVWDERD